MTTAAGATAEAGRGDQRPSHRHLHHGGEDALLWPKLLERAPSEIISVVQLMEGHHEPIEQADREIKAALTGCEDPR